MNILLLSTIYPLPTKENRGTSVCHYFTKEWVKMGHCVRVIHYQAVYPLPFYWLARLNRSLIAAKTGAVVYTSRDKGDIYERDGVLVNRIPLYKPVPHGHFCAKAIRRSIGQILRWNMSAGFVPDIIVGHFPNPQIEVVSLLKEYYCNAVSAIVMHGDVELALKVYGNRLFHLLERIDCWGFRSESIQKDFERRVMKVTPSFLCYSGIPDGFITENNTHDFSSPVSKFIYVGEMIERKYPLTVLDALVMSFPKGGFDLTYVGEGQLLSVLRKRVDHYGVADHVNILGKIPRNSIKSQYDMADCMIMISRGEAYGLVYLEAMSRGCITIASRGEGFDGIIKDGVNGFLCNAGDADDLSRTISRIRSLSKDELLRISQSAIDTSRWLTDTNTAKMYLDSLTSVINQEH